MKIIQLLRKQVFSSRYINPRPCFRAPVIVMSSPLTGTGAHDPAAPKVLAHEIAHLMGAFHDDQVVKWMWSNNPYMKESKFAFRTFLYLDFNIHLFQRLNAEVQSATRSRAKATTS